MTPQKGARFSVFDHTTKKTRDTQKSCTKNVLNRVAYGNKDIKLHIYENIMCKASLFSCIIVYIGLCFVSENRRTSVLYMSGFLPCPI